MLIADNGYDSDAIRADFAMRGGTAVIPTRKTRKNPEPIADFIHAPRNLVERCISKMKSARRTATRYDNTATSFRGLVEIVAARICSAICQHDLGSGSIRAFSARIDSLGVLSTGTI